MWGGRGGTSGFDPLSRATPEQNRLMRNMQKVLGKDSENSRPIFKMNADRSVSYEYTKTRTVFDVRVGKTMSRENDMYERTEHYTGKIMPDGLRIKNRTTYEDELKRKGRVRKAKRT